MAQRDLSPDLRTVILELGLEDQIQLPHATQTAEQLVGTAEAVARLREVLESLLREGRIRLYRGRWDDADSIELQTEDALSLLGDSDWYTFRLDKPDEERLYLVNVNNLRNP
jgi:hypothetical protein